MSYQRGDHSSPLRKPKRAPSGTRHAKRRVSHGGTPPLPKAPPPRPADVRAAGAGPGPRPRTDVRAAGTGPGPRPRACGKRTFFVLVFLRRSLVSTASICQAEGPGTSSRSVWASLPGDASQPRAAGSPAQGCVRGARRLSAVSACDIPVRAPALSPVPCCPRLRVSLL